MNKLHKILLICLAIFIAGCSSDDDNNQQNLKVLQSDTQYASLGGNGKIEVSAVDAITANSSEKWCKPAISGNTINLIVDEDTDINTAKLIHCVFHFLMRKISIKTIIMELHS